jgi:hypothetical protein
MSYSLFYITFDMDTNIQYQEHDGYTNITTGIASNDSDEDIMITLNFPLTNTNVKIKINKYTSINNIPIFIKDKFGLTSIKMIYNDIVITNGSFESLNIKNNSIIKIINNMKTGITDITHNKSNLVKILSLTNSKPRNIRGKLSQEEINENIDKYGYWGAFTQEPETPKKKIKTNTYHSPEYNQTREKQEKREKIEPTELENLGKKYHIAMQELFEREQKEKNEEDNMRSKIAALKEKMKKTKQKKNKIIVKEKKQKDETFCGFKKGFLL